MYRGGDKMSTLNIVFCLWFLGIEVNILWVLEKPFFYEYLAILSQMLSTKGKPLVIDIILIFGQNLAFI